MRPKFLKHCPVCGGIDCKKDIDNPNTMENCNHCGAEWNIMGELTLDSRMELTEKEILSRGWFVDVN